MFVTLRHNAHAFLIWEANVEHRILLFFFSTSCAHTYTYRTQAHTQTCTNTHSRGTSFMLTYLQRKNSFSVYHCHISLQLTFKENEGKFQFLRQRFLQGKQKKFLPFQWEQKRVPCSHVTRRFLFPECCLSCRA